jgi:GNAT superfamily N-acetyltransferase
MVAVNDAIYVAPAYRGKGVGKEILEVTEARLRDRGVDYTYLHTKQPSSLMVDSGYTEVETHYQKQLNEEI